ncbi:MAG: YfcC family protein [Lachnospiraceae bacterium]|nr:YfcC family protein [Lachnospiraceae bacterium]
MKNQTENKKKLAFPDVRALLFMITIFVAILTWIVPAGEFDTEQVGNLTRVIPGTYHYVEQNPQNIWDIFKATVTGFSNQAALIAMICFSGTAISIVEQTGVFEILFGKALRKSKNDAVLIFAVVALCSLGGATNVLEKSTIALVPLGMMLSASMGYDKSLGVLMVYLGSYSGFNVGWAVPATVGTAQTIAELPMLSGWEMRVVFNIVNMLLTYVIIMRYAKNVKKDPTLSMNYSEGMSPDQILGCLDGKNVQLTEAPLTWRHVGSLTVLLAGVVSIVAGSIQFGWSHAEFSTTFFMVIVAVGLVNGYSVNKIAKLFAKGFSSMIGPASVVAFANGIATIAKSGKIINTIVYTLSIPIVRLGQIGGAIFMFFANYVINCFIGSGSGQATVVMPVMVPLADLAGITRQVACQAFQFGDGLCNSATPTATTLMAVLGIGGISYGKYIRRMWPLFILQAVFACIALSILQSIGWTGL